MSVCVNHQLPPYYIDIYALGQCMQSAFALLDIAIPSNLSKYLTLMVGAEIKKRPPCNKLSQCAIFNSDYIKLLENIDELALKSSKEALEVDLMHNTMHSTRIFNIVMLCMHVCIYMTSVPINQTNRYMLFSLNTDKINYANKTLSLCMYVCVLL